MPDRVAFEWGGRYGLTLAVLDGQWLFCSDLDGAFVIDMPRRTIRCFVQKPCEPGWQDVFVRRVLPRVAILAGASAIHGAAVATAHGAILLLGESGTGKSTLSAALGRAGWDILSDDISVIWAPATPEVAPATTGVCLWQDSRDALALPAAGCAPMPAYKGKCRYTSGHDTGVAAQPLRALAFLARSREAAVPGLQRLAAGTGLIEMARQRIRFNPADNRRETLAAFAQHSAIMRVTPCYRLSYPADYTALPRVEALLRGLASA